MDQELHNAVHIALGLMTKYGMSVLGALFMLVAGWIAAGMAHRTMVAVALKSSRIDETIGRFFAGAIRYAVLIFTIIAVLANFGVQTASVIAVLGALGLAIGLALQSTLANVASGLLILFLRPFKIGDYIEAGGAAGTVRAVSLFTTEINTPDNVLNIVPNGAIVGSTIRNYSANERRRVDFVVGIAYEDDIGKAIAVLQAGVEADPRVDRDPAPLIVVGELADSAVNIVVRVWCAAADYWPLKFDLNRAFKEALDRNGITIPFPQRVVHHVGGNPAG